MSTISKEQVKQLVPSNNFQSVTDEHNVSNTIAYARAKNVENYRI